MERDDMRSENSVGENGRGVREIKRKAVKEKEGERKRGRKRKVQGSKDKE